MRVFSFQCSVLGVAAALVMAGCRERVDRGVIVDKVATPPVVAFIPVNKVMIPSVRPGQWLIVVRGTNAVSYEMEEETVHLPREQWEQLQIGQQWERAAGQ